MELVAAVKMAGSAKAFVEGGRLEEALAEIGLLAAVSSLGKAGRAEDKRAQVRSAVTHLEAAQAAIASKIARRGNVMAVTSMERLSGLVRKWQYLAGLMALCYQYLGETRLADECLQDAKKPPVMKGLRGGPVGFGLLIAIITESWRGAPTGSSYQVDWDQFQLPPP